MFGRQHQNNVPGITRSPSYKKNTKLPGTPTYKTCKITSLHTHPEQPYRNACRTCVLVELFRNNVGHSKPKVWLECGTFFL